MKKSLIIAVLALGAVCACTKNEPVLETEENEISFQVASYLNQTKAAKDTVAFVDTVSFGVYAWYDAEKDTEKDQVMMANQEVAKAKGQSDWKTVGKTYYWPKTGDVDFFAYAPYAATPWISCNDDTHVISTGLMSIAGTEDYMYSSMSMNYSNNVKPATFTEVSKVAAGVPVLFHHALSKLTVMFAASMLEQDGNVWEITVNQAEFVKVCTKGSLSMNMDATPTTGVIGWTLPGNQIWTPSDVAADKVDLQAVKADGQVLTTTLTADALNEYSVLPQDLTGMKFHINFTIKASNDNKATWYSTETVDRTFDVAVKSAGATAEPAFATAGAYWKMNSKITYNVTISPSANEILFDPAVVDWAPVSGSSNLVF